jgi:membrane protease YdiL (CAAX protease family)
MLKATNLPVPRLAVNLAALRASMAKRPMRGAMRLGLCAGAVIFLICMLMLLVAEALFSPQQLGDSAAESLKGAGTATIFWMAVVWAPLFETLIGQWLPLEVLRRYKVRASYSLLASAILFSLLHVMGGSGILHASMTLIAGGIFAASYLAARSLGLALAYVAAATAHACSNGLILCGSLVFPDLLG